MAYDRHAQNNARKLFKIRSLRSHISSIDTVLLPHKNTGRDLRVFSFFHEKTCISQYFRLFCHRHARAAILSGCARRLQSLCSREVMLVMHAQILSSPRLTIQAPCQPSLKFHPARGASSAMCSFPRDLRKPQETRSFHLHAGYCNKWPAQCILCVYHAFHSNGELLTKSAIAHRAASQKESDQRVNA